MTSFFWSSGHMGWPFFSIVVFSILCLLATDAAWRVISTSSRKLLSVAGMIWAVGVTVLIVLSYP